METLTQEIGADGSGGQEGQKTNQKLLLMQDENKLNFCHLQILISSESQDSFGP